MERTTNTLLFSLLLLSASSPAIAAPPSSIPSMLPGSGSEAAAQAQDMPGVFHTAETLVDTSWYGGTVWDAVDMRWEAVSGGTWTFDSGVATDFDHAAPDVDPTKDTSLYAHMEGWVGWDRTRPSTQEFRRVSQNDLRWGTSTGCVGSGAGPGFGGDYSYWVGLFPGEAEEANYADTQGGGYGNNWDISLERTFSVQPNVDYAIEFAYWYCSEDGFDYTRIYVNGTLEREWSGCAGAFTDYIPVTADANGNIHLEFRFSSDDNLSDEGGPVYFNSPCGAFALDNVIVRNSQTGISASVSDFETEDPQWVVTEAPGSGDYSNLETLPSVLDRHPISDLCECSIEGNALVFHMDGVHTLGQSNFAVSPWIELSANDQMRPGKVFAFDLLPDLPIQDRVFYQPLVQWVDSGGNISQWASLGFVYYGDGRVCLPQKYDFSSVIPPGSPQVRLALGVINWCGTITFSCTGSSNPTPVFDNVRFGCYDTLLPHISATSLNAWPQDAFPTDGTLNMNSPGRIDCNDFQGNSGPDPFSSIGDTLRIAVNGSNVRVRVVFAVDPGPAFADPTLATALDSWLTKHQFEVSAWGLNWYSARMDTAETNQGNNLAPGFYMTTYHEEDPNFSGSDTDIDPTDVGPGGGLWRLANDIFPDDLLRPGSRLFLFYKAGFGVSPTEWATFPEDTTGLNVLEMEVLPSSMKSDGTFNSVLYIDGFERNPMIQKAVEAGLATAIPQGSENFEGVAWDRWDINAPTSLQPTFSRPNNTQYGASLTQMLGYSTILWDTGNLGTFPFLGPDRDRFIAWLESPGERNLYLSGNAVATNADGLDRDFLASYMGVQRLCSTLREDGCPTGTARDDRPCVPLQEPATAPHFTSSVPSVLAGNACPQLLRFDVVDIAAAALARGGSPRVNLQYGRKGPASISNVNATHSYKTVFDGFAPAYLRDADCTGTGAVGARFADMLAWFQTVGDRDNDFIPDNTDACPDLAPSVGEVDRDGDGCPESASSFRFVKFFSPDQFPVFYETDATGDPRITDGSDFSTLADAFSAWTAVSGVSITGGDDGTRAGPSVISTNDGRNSITFTDPKGYLPGVLAITPTTTVDEVKVIGGRTYRPGEIVEFDMMFNSSQFSFSTPSYPGPVGSYNLLALATHEFGHAFGFSHTFAPEATMFYVVPAGAQAASLESDDLVLARRGYGATPPQLTVEGRVLRADGVTPIVGAAVYATSAATGTILQFTPTGVDGTYRFYELPEDFIIHVHPLDGTGVTNGLNAAAINPEMAAIARTDFLPETYDGVDETNSDFDATGVVLSPAGGPYLGADILLNADQAAPAVVATTPGDGATNVAATSAIAIKFDERLDADYFFAHPDVHITNLNTGTGIGGSAAILQEDSLVVFTPAAPFQYFASYEFSIGPDLRDISGNYMIQAVTFTFQIEPQPPVNLAALSSEEAPIGGALVIHGAGFDPEPDGNLVRFEGGVDISPDGATPDRLILTIPEGVASGDVTVEVGLQISNPLPLTILPPKAPPSGNRLGEAALAGIPRKLAMEPGGATVYVAHDQGLSVVNALPSSPDFLQTFEVPVAGGCSGVACLPTGHRLVVISPQNPRLRLLDVDPASPGFLSSIVDVNLGTVPVGVTVVPGGAELLVSYASRVVLHSAATADFGQELRAWSSPDYGFLGDLGVSASGEEAYAASSGGSIAILGLLPGEGIVARVDGGSSPREIWGSPNGASFLEVDEEGVVRRYGERGSYLQPPIAVGGGSRGLTVSPEGAFAYGANYILNRIDVFDLQQSDAALAGSFPTGVDPVDIGTGSGGRYICVATAGQNRLEIYDTESGALVSAVNPVSGGPGTLLTVSGAGFDPVPSSNVVSIGGVLHTPIRVAPDGTSLVVIQSPSVTQGPLIVTSGGLSSNPAPYAPVQRVDAGVFASAGVFPAGGPGIVSLTSNPDGTLLLFGHSDGSLSVVNGSTSRDGLQEVRTTMSPAETQLAGVGHMEITPGGDKVYVEDPTLGQIAIFSVDPLADVPLLRIGTVPGIPVSDFAMAVSSDLDGLLYVACLATGEVYEIDTGTDAVVDVHAGFVSPEALAVRRDGKFLLVADRSGGDPALPAVIQALDIDPASQSVGSIVAALPLGYADVRSLTATPTGGVIALVSDGAAATAVDIVIQEGPTTLTAGNSALGIGTGDVSLVCNRSGTLIYAVDAGGQRVRILDSASMVVLAPEVSGLAGVVGSAGGTTSADDARLYVTEDSAFRAVDLTPVSGVELFSGGGQTGVSDLPLPSPISVRLNTAQARRLLQGSVIQFTTSGGGHFEGGGSSVVVAADERGIASARYTPGLQPGPETISMLSAAGTAVTSVQTLEDTTYAPPTLLRVAPDGSGTTLPGVTTTISAEFSKALKVSTVTGESFSLRTLAGTPVPGTFGYANSQRRVVFVPRQALEYDTDYEFELTAGIQDQAGRPLSNPSAHAFRTPPPLPPALGAITAPSGSAGDRIVLSGTGFSRIAEENLVQFNGILTQAVSSDPGAITAVVPTGATSGPMLVQVGSWLTNAIDFTVLVPLPEPLTTVVDVARVPESGQDIAVLPDGSRAYITLPKANAIIPLKRDGSTLVVEDMIPVGIYPFGIVASPDGTRVFVSNFFSNDVAVVDTDPGSPSFHRAIAFIPVGTNPSGLAPNPNDRDLYVLNYGDKTLSIVDVDSSSANAYSARSTVDTNSSSQSVAVTPDGGRIIVGTSTGILIIQADDTSARSTVDVNSSTQAVAVTPDGGLAVVLTTSNLLILIDIQPGSPTEGQARATVDTNTSGKGVAVSPDGGTVYVIGELEILVFSIKKSSSPTPGGGAESGSFFELTLETEIPVGENPTAAAFDPSSGDELFVVNSGDKTVTLLGAVQPPQIVDALVDVDPNALNLNANGQYVVAYLQFPEPIDPGKVAVETVRLEGVIAADSTYGELVDHDLDGILEKKLRFVRSEVVGILPPEDSVRVAVTGFVDGLEFSGTDSIKIVRPQRHKPKAGDVVVAGSPTEVTWAPVDTMEADRVDIFFSPDGGETWNPVAEAAATDTTIEWDVPEVLTSNAKLLLVARKSSQAGEAADGTLTGVIGYGGLDDSFIIDKQTSVTGSLPLRFAFRPPSPNPFSTSARLVFDLPAAERVTVRIYALDGSLVRTVLDGVPFEAGRNGVVWDGRDGQGRSVSAGVYFIHLRAGKHEARRKLVRLYH